MRRKRKTSGVKKTLKYTALAGARAFAAATAFFFKEAVKRKRKKGFFMFQAPDEPEAYKHEIAEGKEWLKEMEPTSEYWMIRSHDGLLLKQDSFRQKKRQTKRFWLFTDIFPMENGIMQSSPAFFMKQDTMCCC